MDLQERAVAAAAAKKRPVKRGEPKTTCHLDASPTVLSCEIERVILSDFLSNYIVGEPKMIKSLTLFFIYNKLKIEI